MRPPKVFVSYSHTDKDVVHGIIRSLDRVGVPYFLDEKDIALGENISDRVQGAIPACSHLLVVISAGSRKSQWVPYEIGIARGLGLGIIPFLTHVSEDPFPFIRDLKYTSDPVALERYFGKLIESGGPPGRNPKPYRVRDFVLDEAYLMLGDCVHEMDISARYNHEHLEYPPEIAEILPHLRTLASDRVKKSGAQYFNGPNARLVRFMEDLTRQDTRGHEQRGVTLELGPVSWEEYTILNTFLDFRLADGRTIREVFTDREQLFANDRDFRWCKLSGILSLALIPITSDGFGLIQNRNPRGVSTEGGRLTSGVAENIHRYLDEAHPSNLTQRVHELGLPSEVHALGIVDENYQPRGTPSPLLAAQRGLWEEISAFLGEELSLGAYRFLSIGFELTKFQPVLTGVIHLGYDKAEVERLRTESPGKDHSEFLDVIYLPLDATASETLRMLRDRERWVPGGLAAFMGALQYWRAHGHR